MNRLYLFDTYLYEADGVVVASGEQPDGTHFVVLSQTIFHPRGGGQREDRGTIAGIGVVDVRDSADGIVHTLKSVAPVVGAHVELKVDPESRIRNSRLHTAGHLLAHVVHASRPQLAPFRAHHWDGEARVEFAAKEAVDLDALVLELNQRLTTVIAAGLEVTSSGTSPRAVAIGGYSAQPCGGTHVRSTEELAVVTATKASFKKGVLRISYTIS